MPREKEIWGWGAGSVRQEPEADRDAEKGPQKGSNTD